MSTLEEIARKVKLLRELPTQRECLRLQKHMESRKGYSWMNFCKKNGIYQVVHKELVAGLVRVVCSLQKELGNVWEQESIIF